MKTLPLMAALLFTGACASEIETDEDGAVVVEQEPLATVTLPHGELRFVVFPEHGGTGMLTISRPDKYGQHHVIDEELSPLAAYLAYTSPDVAVPRALLAMERAEDVLARAAQRPAVDAVAEPIAGTAGEALYTTNAQYCQGVTSAAYADEICPLDDASAYESFCHNGTWHSVTDHVGSNNKGETGRSRTLACGANGRVRQYYKFWGVWYKPIDESVPSGERRTWTHTSGLELERKITHSRQADSGFVRGTSDFSRSPF